MRRVLVLAMLVGCGRLSFEPVPPVGDAPRDTEAADAAIPGLLLHFAFDSDGLLRDRAGHPDATCASCPQAIAGRVGDGAAQFDGITDCVVVADAADLRPAEFTFAVWLDTATTVNATTFSRPLMGATSDENTFDIFHTPTIWGIALAGSAVTMPPRTGWHHYAGVFDGQRLALYVDGAAMGAAAASPAQYREDDLRIGCDFDAGAIVNWLPGAIDDLRFYGRALTATEVGTLAAM